MFVLVELLHFTVLTHKDKNLIITSGEDKINDIIRVQNLSKE